MKTVAALYVQTGGAYFGLRGVDPWDEARDARHYTGPHPVVAHPPCQRWGRYWSGAYNGQSKVLGDDGGCFASALTMVRWYGGVIEHPAGSLAWRYFGLKLPVGGGGWSPVDDFGGWGCEVEQGHYGHLARKKTWLYASKTRRTALLWGPSSPVDPVPRSAAWQARAKKDGVCVLLSSKAREVTPPPFRDLLLKLARSVPA